MPIIRKIISKTATILANIRLYGKVKCKDPVSGFFGIRTDFFRSIIKNKKNNFELQGYKVLFDILKTVKKDNLIGSVEYTFGLRTSGESKIGKKQIILFLRSLFK